LLLVASISRVSLVAGISRVSLVADVGLITGVSLMTGIEPDGWRQPGIPGVSERG